MFLDLDRRRPSAAPWGNREIRSDWTVLIPFFNERDYLAATIASIAAQSLTPWLILIDNGSTDGSADLARAACEAHRLNFMLITETSPGKTAALCAAMPMVCTPYVATCDADTLYPPHYLAAAQKILDRPGCAVAGAYFVAPGTSEADRVARARTVAAAATLLPKQCHTGGAGQAFRSAALRAAGGFDPTRWNFVLEDHEIIHRVTAFGAMRYAADLWCIPSSRDRDRDSIRWTLLERLVYSMAAPFAGDWFFYSFLARRLRQRRLSSNRMRERQFHHLEGPPFATSHPMC
ncbi:MAG: glycosyl transferase family 2 [Sphingomonas sp. 28-62-20]|nr:MAG: glycosyl transferase family 2 [Sphingomonas sp. 28-62-20]